LKLSKYNVINTPMKILLVLFVFVINCYDLFASKSLDDVYVASQSEAPEDTVAAPCFTIDKF